MVNRGRIEKLIYSGAGGGCLLVRRFPKYWHGHEQCERAPVQFHGRTITDPRELEERQRLCASAPRERVSKYKQILNVIVEYMIAY